jgi:antirestriction protein ArdC
MKIEQAKQIANKAIEQLSQALEKGQSQTLKIYLLAISRFHEYSFRNVMMIASQKPTASYVAGYHAWRTLGRFVKKGEEGVMILAPIVRAKTSTIDTAENSESPAPIAFRPAYVFDISQTDGKEIPQLGRVSGNSVEQRERLARFIAEQDIELEYSADIAPARGRSSGGKITLLPGLSAPEDFATLVHELAHEMLHRDQRRSQTTKRVRETEAEAVAFVVCSGIGLDTGTAAQETTLLNILGKFIANDERIVLIEDTAEIQLGQPNLVRFEARQVQDGRPAVSIRDLLKASLRHRPDRIVLGEIRGIEAFDLLQLLNTGHSGTLSTIHANSAKQGLSRFTSCVLQSGIELPYRAIKNNISDSLNVVIQIERQPGLRFISEVLEINQYDADKDSFELTPICARSSQTKEIP